MAASLVPQGVKRAYVLLCAATVTLMPGSGGSLRTMLPDEDTTRVHPNWAARHLQPIPPGVFGDFLEHLGDAVYHTLWADGVYNPAFWHAGGAPPDRWTLQCGAEVSRAGEGIEMPSEAAVSQTLFLPVHRRLKYHGELWASSPSGSPKAMVRLTQEGKVAAQCMVPIGRGISARGFPFILGVAPSAARPGKAYELTIEVLGGTCTLFRVELFPDDAVAGMDPEVVQAAKALHITLLRWPGGNFSSGYHWRQGVGPRFLRPTVRNPAWPGLETHAFGTDEFLRFCRIIGAQPMICVNAGDGTPEEAADWVEYCNGSPDTPMGRLRARNGHPAPYGVRLWEVGNELYGPWQIGHTDAEGNGRRFVAFRQAMLARDHAIKVIATGKGDGFVGNALHADDAWNATLLHAAVANGGPPDLVSIHPLVPLPGDLASNGADYDAVYLAAMAHPGWFGRSFVPHLMEQMQRNAGGSRLPRLAVTEWGIILGGPDWRNFPNHDAQSGAVYAGLFLNQLMRCGGSVDVANVTGLLHGGGIKKARGKLYVDPMYFVQRMYGEARPQELIPSESDGPGYSTAPRGFLPGVAFTPWVDVCAAVGDGNLYLFMVNVDPRRSRRVEVKLPRGIRKVRLEVLAADPRAHNSGADANAVQPSRRELTVEGGIFTCVLDACSVSVARARWRHDAGRQAGVGSP
ncbi:MAG: alpha-L-arabinofuranosidase C-terminal domain-containing protein [Chthonomonadales bacterium]